MVDIEVGEFTGRRRFDPVTAASVVLTVDAALFLVVAVVGVPFLLFIFGDDYTGTWRHMAPLITWWVVAALLGAACTTAVIRSFGRGGAGARRAGAVSAIATVVAVCALIGTTFERAPLLALFGGLLAIANVAAARVLTAPGRVDPAEDDFESVFTEETELEDAHLEDAQFEDAQFEDAELGAAEFEDAELSDAGPAEPRITVELARTGPGRTVPSAARRRLRGKAAMQTHAGVRLTRRPRR
jgi:hypothetical protein